MRTSGLVVAALLLACISPSVAGPGPVAAPVGDALSPATYQQSDLQGVWEFNTLASGPGAPWWERARATIAADGSFTATTSESGGGTGTINGTFSLSSAGLITVLGSSTFGGALGSDKSVLAATDTWSSGSPGTTELKVGVKMAGSYKQSDLAGAWETNVIASGPGAPWWERGRITVAADGGVTGTMTDNLGNPDPVATTFGISSSGIVTVAESATARGVLDAGKTVLAMTSTWASGNPGTTDLSVAVKMAGTGTYSLANLAGTWEFNSLATGPGAPWWERGRITIAADGTFSGTALESSGGSGTPSGTFNISPDGVVSLVGRTTTRGVLDAGKAVLVFTDLWSGGTTEIKVGTRVSTGIVDVPAAPALAFALDPLRPNPTRSGALIVQFTLPTAAPARLELLDVAGRRLAAHEVGSLGAGQHTLDLGAGQHLAPGLYLVRLTQGANTRTTRVAVLK